MKIVSKIVTGTNLNIIQQVDEYKPLQNLDESNFTTDSIEFDFTHPVEMNLQSSYDNSTNIILTDGCHNMRIINSGFSKIGDKWDVPKHNGLYPTNKYNSSNVDLHTQLILYPSKYPSIHLDSVQNNGNLQGGNYTFYFKYVDNDGNSTDIVAESGIVSIFHGDWKSINSISGCLLDETTNKSIVLELKDVDEKFNKVSISYIRKTSDTIGISLTKAYKIQDSFDLVQKDGRCLIQITGYEAIEEIDPETINIQYNFYSSAKTQSSTQSMLFLGNLSTEMYPTTYSKLDELSKTIESECIQNHSVGYVDENYVDNTDNGGEYYNPKNIYYYLGYWPDELYKIGVVYIFANGSQSPVFNLNGGEYDGRSFINGLGDGIYHIPNWNVIQESDTSQIMPIGLRFHISKEIYRELRKLNVISLMFVRQLRKVNTIAQGLSIGVNNKIGIPMPFVNLQQPPKLSFEKIDGSPGFEDTPMSGNFYITESFLLHDCESTHKSNNYFHFGQWFLGKPDHYPLPLSNERFRRVVPVPSIINPVTGTYNYNGMGADKSWKISADKDVSLSDFDQISYRSWITSNSYYGLLCTDAYCVPQIQSMLNGQKYHLSIDRAYWNTDPNTNVNNNNTTITYFDRAENNNNTSSIKIDNSNTFEYKCLWIPPESINKTVYSEAVDKDSNNSKNLFFKFSTQIGNTNSTIDFKQIVLDTTDPTIRQLMGRIKGEIDQDFPTYVRGHFAPFIGLIPYKTTQDNVMSQTSDYETVKHTVHYPIDKNIIPSCIYNIKSFGDTIEEQEKYRNLVKLDNSEYFAITDRINLTPELTIVDAYRGDCYTTTTSTRMQHNFIDPEVPLQDNFVDWKNFQREFKGNFTSKPDGVKINRGDLNAVQIGYWLTYKSLSNYNLGLRSEDKSQVGEISLIGNHRSFYPLRGLDRSSGNKLPDSSVLNAGYSTTLPSKRYVEYNSVPYNNLVYTNRIAYSNIQAANSFENQWRVWQGLRYKDIDSSFGEIVKLETIDNNLFCVFEHGCGIIPINEKALIQTTTGQNVHIHGSDVISSQVTVVSPFYGSTWHNSIIKTPNGIYGVDTSCNKIWRFNSNGFIIISDFRVQRLLNECLTNLGKEFLLGITDVRTHYNNYKNDVLFTFYNKDMSLNLCFNEMLDMFVCKYTWMPFMSENINSQYYSLERSNYFDDTSKQYVIYKHNDVISKPTNWYGKQHPFEFEIVVAQPAAAQKIFDNLSIISNNVEPESLEISIIGDSYDFKHSDKTSYPTIRIGEHKYEVKQEIDSVTNEIIYKIIQPCLNIKDFGRRLGNIEYKEDKWISSIQPITIKINEVLDQARIRDKWAKIRIKYNGDKLSIITALLTTIRISYV